MRGRSLVGRRLRSDAPRRIGLRSASLRWAGLRWAGLRGDGLGRDRFRCCGPRRQRLRWLLSGLTLARRGPLVRDLSRLSVRRPLRRDVRLRRPGRHRDRAVSPGRQHAGRLGQPSGGARYRPGSGLRSWLRPALLSGLRGWLRLGLRPGLRPGVRNRLCRHGRCLVRGLGVLVLLRLPGRPHRFGFQRERCVVRGRHLHCGSCGRPECGRPECARPECARPECARPECARPARALTGRPSVLREALQVVIERLVSWR